MEIDIIESFIYMMENNGFVPPKPIALWWLKERKRNNQPWIVHADDWGRFIYNPLPGQDYDPDASPRPTWDELVEAYYEAKLDILGRDRNTVSSKFSSNGGRVRSFLTDHLILHKRRAIHAGDGLSHMTGLIHLVENSNMAGKILPPVHMRTLDGEKHTFWTQREMREFMGNLAERENIIESAHNRIMQEVKRLDGIFRDNTKTAKERYEAYDSIQNLTRKGNFPDNPETEGPIEVEENTYYSSLLAEIDKYDPEALPEDIPTLREVYNERIEAIATSKIADIRNAATQHGIDIPDSCVDQNKATTKVSNKKQKAQLFLARATTKEKLKEAFDLWKSRIEAVTVLNTPVFAVNGVDISDGVSSDDPFRPPAGREFVVRSKHPEDDIGGIAIIEAFIHNGDDDSFETETRIPVDDTKSHEIVVTLDDDFTGTIKFNFKARNICGPSEVWIEFSTPTE